MFTRWSNDGMNIWNHYWLMKIIGLISFYSRHVYVKSSLVIIFSDFFIIGLTLKNISYLWLFKIKSQQQNLLRFHIPYFVNRFLKFQNGDKIGSVPTSSLSIRVCRFSPDGTMLVTAGDDEKAFIWNTDTMEYIA